MLRKFSSKEDRKSQREARAIERAKSRALYRSEVVLACVSFVASADGPINSREMEFIESLAVEYELDLSAARLSNDLSRMSTESCKRSISSNFQAAFLQISSKRTLLMQLLELVVCDGSESPEEIEAVNEVARLLQFPLDRLQRLQRRHGSRIAARSLGRADTLADEVELPWYFKVLGCKPTDFPATIKRSYRRLAAETHPDKYATCGPAEIAYRVQQFQKLQMAYKEACRDVLSRGRAE